MQRRWTGLVILVTLGGLFLCAAPTLRAQQPGDDTQQRGQFAGMQRVSGEVTAINGGTLTIKAADGAVSTIVTTDNTKVMKRGGGGAPAALKLSELKVGDGVIAAGNLDAPNKSLHAAVVFATDAAEVKKMKDNLGKTYIMGKVTAIDVDNAKLTLTRPDGVSQTIGFDETTSFKRGRAGRGGGMGADASAAPAPSGESITLADIKVGDNVGGQGSVKGGVFVPTVLSVGTPGQGRHHNGDAPGGAPAASPAPGPGY